MPRLGALRQLRPAGGAQAGQRRWTFGHACGLAGLVVAGIAGAAALWMRSSSGAIVDETSIRAAVAGTPITELYRVWPMLRRGGIARPPSPEEERRIRMARSAAAMERLLWLTALAGLTVAAGGGLMLAVSSDRLQRETGG